MPTEQIYLNDEKWNQCINSLKEMAKRIFNNDIRLNDGAVEIVALLHKLPSPLSYNSNFVIFHALSSETTHLPLAHVREKWSESGLIKADVELKEIEERFDGDIRKACEQILIFDFDGFRARWLNSRFNGI
jgi:hypothetical protein